MEENLATNSNIYAATNHVIGYDIDPVFKVNPDQVSLRASADCRGGGTGREFVDNLKQTGTEGWNKWFTGHETSAEVLVRFSPNSDGSVGLYVNKYALCSANDCPERDPHSWTVEGLVVNAETDVEDFVLLHRVNPGDCDFRNRWEWHTFTIDSMHACVVSGLRFRFSTREGTHNGLQAGHLHFGFGDSVLPYVLK